MLFPRIQGEKLINNLLEDKPLPSTGAKKNPNMTEKVLIGT